MRVADMIRFPVSVRCKAALELSIIALLTLVFLLLFPRRSPAVDVGLAAVALVGLALSTRYTKKVIWAAAPPSVVEDRYRRCLIATIWVTMPAVLLLFTIGMVFGYRD